MDQRLTPEFFYGSAIAALTGLLFGLMLHAGWEKRPGGPQLLFSSAAAEALYSPTTDDQAAAQPSPINVADLDTGYIAPDPLPVTRLNPEMFEVQPAAAGETERQDADTDVADAAPQAPRPDLD